MNQLSPFKLMLVAFLSCIVAACGGGGTSGGLGGTGGTDGTTTDTLPTITLTLVDAQDVAVTEINGSDEATAKVVVLDSAGVAVSGNLVSFSVTIGVLAGNGSAVTDSSGIATIKITAGTNAGAGTVTASTSVEEADETTSITSNSLAFESDGQGTTTTSSSDLSIELVLVDAAGTAINPPDIDADNPGILKATVTDGLVGLENTIVQFSVTNGDLFPASDLTNADGVATASLAAGSVPGAGTATATFEVGGQTFESELNFSTLGNAGDTVIALSLAFSDATPGNDSNIVTTSEPGSLTIQVEDTGGSDLPNRTASITTTLGLLATDACPVDELDGVDNLTAVSDAAGRITLSVCGYATIGTGDIVVTVGDTSETVQFEVGVDGLQIGDYNKFIEDETIVISSSTGTTTETVDITATVVVKAGSETLSGAGNDYTAVSSGIICEGGTKCVNGAELTISYENASPVFNVEKLVAVVTPLSAGGVSEIIVSVLDQEENTIDEIDITFTSNCAEEFDSDSGEALALISQTVTSVETGKAVATYQANGCLGDDVITATETSSGAKATGTIEVLPPHIGSIRFDSVVVDPDDLSITSIQIKESGGIDRGNVVFQVLDVFGAPAPDQNVVFELTSNVGGMVLVDDEGLTDADGLVSATVAAGFIPTTVRVRASLDVDTDDDGENDTTLVTLSELLTVNTGIPDQNSMSISTSVQNIEGDGLDGLTTTITVRMSDAFNNPVTDGTAVTFRTELASVESDCLTSGGACSVVLTTQDPRTPLLTSYKTVSDGCPVARITDEQVTIDTIGSDLVGESNYKMDINATVVVKIPNFAPPHTFLSPGLGNDYTINTNGSGITCRTCTDGQVLWVTYDRLWLDEDPFDTPDQEVTVAVLTGDVPASLQVDTDTAVVVIDATGRTLEEDVDYAVDVDGSGITCIATSTECIDTAVLTISYDKADAGKSHAISNPGVATMPFSNVTWVPCRASYRAATSSASAYNSGLGQPYGARSTVLAYALGEESFIDSNGNGLYDFGESFVDLPEAFLDKNEDSVFGNGDPNVDDSRNQANPLCYGPVAPITNPLESLNACYQDGGEEETFIDFGDASSLNDRFDSGNLIYNGTLCPKDISDRADTITDCGGVACAICTSLPCDEATERYCTRDLVNIRKEIDILLSGSGARFGRRDGYGSDSEFVSNFDLTGTLASNEYTASSSVTANDGTSIPNGGIFTIGDSNSSSEVAPGIGEWVTLTSGSSSIVIDIADIYNGYLPATATIAAVSGEGGCVIQNSPGGVVGEIGSVGFTQIGISVAPPDDPPNGGAPITISVTTADGGVLSETAVSCVY